MRSRILALRSGVPMTLCHCLAAACLLVGATGISIAASPAPWPDDFTARLEALALLQTLNADLLSHDSATLTLDRWCDRHHLAAPAEVKADRVPGVDKVPDEEQRRTLGVAPGDLVRYRRVRLRCGGEVLSEADNFYVPQRLTPDMNRQLDTTDIAFGRAVQPLHFTRHTLSAKLLWAPLPADWETGAALPAGHAGVLDIPDHLLEHRAVLTLPDGTPFSLVVETYTGAVLRFGPPRLP